MSRSRGRPAVPSTSRLASRSRTGASSSGLPIAPSCNLAEDRAGSTTGRRPTPRGCRRAGRPRRRGARRTARPGRSGDGEVRPREVDDHRRSRDVGDTERHVLRRGRRRRSRSIDTSVAERRGWRGCTERPEPSSGAKSAIASPWPRPTDRRETAAICTVAPPSHSPRPGDEVELLGPGRGDAVLVVAVLVGVAHDQPAADGGMDAGGYGVAPVGGDHGVDPDLAAVDDDRDEPFDPTLERHRRSPCRRRRRDVSPNVDMKPPNPSTSRTIRGSGSWRSLYAVRCSAWASASRRRRRSQLVVEHREVAGDRLEVVAGGDVDDLRPATRARRGRAKRSRDRAATTWSGSAGRRPPTRRSCAAASSCPAPPAPNTSQPARLLQVDEGRDTGPGVRGHRSCPTPITRPGSGGPARRAGRPGRRRW